MAAFLRNVGPHVGLRVSLHGPDPERVLVFWAKFGVRGALRSLADTCNEAWGSEYISSFMEGE